MVIVNTNMNVNLHLQGRHAKFIRGASTVLEKPVKTDIPKSVNGGWEVNVEG